VVVIMVDDADVMDFQPFGGEARMLNIQALAERGVRFTNYRTSPMTSLVKRLRSGKIDC
jgi:arylsulfatase A-like enzyme